MLQSKSHLKEDISIIIRITQDITDIVKDLEGNFGAEQQQRDNKSLIKEENSQIDVSNFELSDRLLIMSYLKATDDFFKSLDKKKFDELKSSVTKAASVSTSYSAQTVVKSEKVEPLTDSEIMLLMTNFHKLDSEKQNWLLEILLGIAKTDPERYKTFKSPF